MIICYDFFDHPHEINEADIRDRHGSYGVNVKDDQVLLTKLSYSGRWEIPGGGIEDGETEKDALIREFKEETGLDIVRIGKIIATKEAFYYDLPTKQAWHAYKKYFFIEECRGELLVEGNGDDSETASYISITSLSMLNVTTLTKDVIKLAMSTLK